MIRRTSRSTLFPSPPACIPGTSQSFSATGAFQTYTVPPGTTALLITANGASGGRGRTPDPTSMSPPSHGAHLQAGTPVGGLASLAVVVGSPGGAAANMVAGRGRRTGSLG